ncbi:MAG: cation diffusion facilitator family transporter, partial [Acidiferrobacteraceae bacterium]
MVHSHSHHGHHHGDGHQGSRDAIIALLVTLGFSLFEAVAAAITHSLALLGDAGHMLFDAIALGVAAVAYRMARRPPSRRHSYGLVRAEIVAALANALLMVGIVIAL